MAELDGIPAETKARLEQLDKADVVIGFVSARAGGVSMPAVAAVRAAADRIRPGLKAVIVQNDGSGQAAEAAQPEGVEIVMIHTAEPAAGAPEHTSDTYRALFRISERLGSAACGALALDAETITPDLVQSMIQPVLENKLDLVIPLYAHRKFDGLINTGIVYPFTRAMYGRRIRYPMSADLCLSPRMIGRLDNKTGGDQSAGVGWIPLHAVRAGYEVGEVALSVRPAPPKTAGDLSSVLSGILGSLFVDVERNAVVWQKTRSTAPVAVWGNPSGYLTDQVSVNTRAMIETFQLGFRNLMEVWSPCLPPATLLELKRLTRVPQEQFRLADAVWARVVYDFALAHRLRTISRDHLLRAMTPLYLAWVASWVLELCDAAPAAVEARLEKLCAVFEQERPYLVARWRWPDRFNP